MDWEKLGQGCQQLGCAIMLIPIVVFFLYLAFAIGCN